MKLVAALILAFLVFCKASALNSNERAALANLMIHWPSLTNQSIVTHPWNSSFDQACNYFSSEGDWDGWSGLFCNSDGSVLQLALNGIPLGNTLPQSLTQFPSLKILNLYATNLNGTLSSWISQFPALEELSIGINQLKGSLPPEILHLSSLKRLSIDHNQFSGVIPSLPSNMTYFWAVSNNLTLCPTSSLPEQLQSCDVTLQSVESCGNGCNATWEVCKHDTITSCAPISPTPTFQPVLEPSTPSTPLQPSGPTIECPSPQPGPTFTCDLRTGYWYSKDPVNVDSLSIPGRVEVSGSVSAHHLNFYFSDSSVHTPELVLHKCWYHTAPEVSIHFDSAMDLKTMQDRVFTLVEILNQNSCPDIASWTVAVGHPTKSSCTTMKVELFDPGRDYDRNKLSVSFKLKKCKTWLWVLLGVLIPSVAIISVIITILTKDRYKRRFCPCLVTSGGPAYELIHSESRDSVY